MEGSGKDYLFIFCSFRLLSGYSLRAEDMCSTNAELSSSATYSGLRSLGTKLFLLVEYRSFLLIFNSGGTGNPLMAFELEFAEY